MSFLMQQNLATKRLVVTFADNNTPHPTKRCHIIDMAIDSSMVAFICPQTTATNDLANSEQLPKTDAKRQTYTYYIY